MSETHPLPEESGPANAEFLQPPSYTNAEFLQPPSYTIGEWRDGPVGSSAPVNAVVITFEISATALAEMLLRQTKDRPHFGDVSVSIGVRIKSRGEYERMVAGLKRHADNVWPR